MWWFFNPSKHSRFLFFFIFFLLHSTCALPFFYVCSFLPLWVDVEKEEIVCRMLKKILFSFHIFWLVTKIYFFFPIFFFFPSLCSLTVSFIVTCFLLILISSSCCRRDHFTSFTFFPTRSSNISVIFFLPIRCLSIQHSAAKSLFTAKMHLKSRYDTFSYSFMVESKNIFHSFIVMRCLKVNFYSKLQFPIKYIVQCLHSSLISCFLSNVMFLYFII